MKPAPIFVLHQVKGARLPESIAATGDVFVLEIPPGLDTGQRVLHLADMSQEFRRRLYAAVQGAIAACAGQQEDANRRICDQVSPVMFRMLDLASLLHLCRDKAGVGGAFPEVHFYCDSYRGYKRVEVLAALLRQVGFVTQALVPARQNAGWRLRTLRERLAATLKARVRRQMARRAARPRAGGEQQHALVFHGSAPRIWKPLQPLMQAARQQGGAAVVAAITTRSVRGTPFGFGWDAVYALDEHPLTQQARQDLQTQGDILAQAPGLDPAQQLMLRAALPRMLAAARQSYANEAAVRRLLADYSKVTFISSYGFGTTTAGLFALAGKYPGLSFAMLPHGMLDLQRAEAQAQPLPGRILCWSSSMAKTVESTSSISATLVGAEAHELEGGAQASDSALCRILVAFGRPDTVLDIGTFNRAVDIVDHAARQHPDLIFIVRRHPSDVSGYWDARIPKMPKNVVESSYPTLHEELTSVFCVLTMHSTVGLEAICRDRCVFTVRPEGANYAAMPDYVGSGASELAETAEGLAAGIATVRHQWPRDGRASLRTNYARSIVEKVDLHSVIERLLVGSP